MLTPFVAATRENNENNTGDVDLTVKNWNDEAHDFIIYLDNISMGTEWVNESGSKDDKVKKTFRHLEEGNHTFSIRWFDPDDNDYHEDSAVVEVVGGEKRYIQLNIAYISGRRR
jgi:hypothetical protein